MSTTAGFQRVHNPEASNQLDRLEEIQSVFGRAATVFRALSYSDLDPDIHQAVASFAAEAMRAMGEELAGECIDYARAAQKDGELQPASNAEEFVRCGYSSIDGDVFFKRAPK
jgi:hypothetical protein